MEKVPYTAYKATLPSETKLGVVHLNVKDLANQIIFYTQGLKMTVYKQTDKEAILGDTTKPMLHLHQSDDFKRYNNTTGMYHFALLYPSEEELAKAIAWLGNLQYPQAPTDHGMSKTTYLRDAEGNDIELYVRTLDRGDYVVENGILQMRYKADGRLTDGRDPLDLDELFATISEGADIQSPIADMQMGHIHLYGSDIDRMTEFYTDTIGFATGIIDKRFRMGDVGLDDIQNHVVAYNSWKDTDFPAPEDALGLRYFTISLPDQTALDALLERLKEADVEVDNKEDGLYLQDPSHITLKLEIA